MSTANNEQEVRVIHPLHQKPSTSITLVEFFPKGQSDKVVVDKISCSKFDDGDDETNEEQSSRKTLPLKRDDNVLNVLETLPMYMGWQQIFYLLKEVREQIVLAICHAKLYANKMKDIQFTSKCATCTLSWPSLTMTCYYVLNHIIARSLLQDTFKGKWLSEFSGW